MEGHAQREDLKNFFLVFLLELFFIASKFQQRKNIKNDKRGPIVALIPGPQVADDKRLPIPRGWLPRPIPSPHRHGRACESRGSSSGDEAIFTWFVFLFVVAESWSYHET